jgi:hypothetical protein
LSDFGRVLTVTNASEDIRQFPRLFHSRASFHKASTESDSRL